MEISKEQKEAIEYLEKYTKWETYGERNLEKDIITVLELLKETQRKLEIVNGYNYWVLLAADRGIQLKKLQNENEKLKTKLLDILKGQKVIKEETPQYIKENYISKEKIKDRIKKLSVIKGDFATYITTSERIKALLELLESEE